VIVPLNDNIKIVSINDNSLEISDLIRISIPETIDYFLEEKNDLHTALKIIDKFKVESNKITEYQLKQGHYSNLNLLNKYLEKVSFKDITFIILKQ
jgi:hypothetical protein